MTRQSMNRVVLAAILAATASTATAQPPSPLPAPEPNWKLDFLGPEIPLGPIVKGAPYSANATTSVSQILADGTQISRTTTAKLFRDSDGRVRREQTILGLGALDAASESLALVTIVDPVAQVTYVLDPRTKQARQLPAAKLRVIERGVPPLPPPPPGQPASDRRQKAAANLPQSLGTKQLDGLDVVGSRRVETIAAGRIGNDRPIEIVDERWESPALNVLVLSQHHDPRTGDIEYRLTNISRTEPPRDLFSIPADYTVVDTPDVRR